MLLLPTWDGDILKGKVNYFDSAYTDEVKKKKIGQSAAKHLEDNIILTVFHREDNVKWQS